VLCPESGFGKALQPGRYSAAISDRDLSYTDSFVGISLRNQDPRLAPILSVILNSKLSAFQLAFGGSNIGLKQPKIEKIDLEELMIPDLVRLDEPLLLRAAQLGRQLGPKTGPSTLRQIDELVLDMCGLSSPDRRIVDDVLGRSRPLFMDTRRERLRTVARVEERKFLQYGNEVTHWLDTLLREAGTFRAVLNRAVRIGPDVVALRFEIEAGALKPLPPFTVQSPELGEETSPGSQARRFMRVYAGSTIYIIKPDERRFWRVSDAQADVQLILDDQVLRLKRDCKPLMPSLGQIRWRAADVVH
jgi:hypothetical protein